MRTSTQRLPRQRRVAVIERQCNLWSALEGVKGLLTSWNTRPADLSQIPFRLFISQRLLAYSLPRQPSASPVASLVGRRRSSSVELFSRSSFSTRRVRAFLETISDARLFLTPCLVLLNQAFLAQCSSLHANMILKAVLLALLQPVDGYPSKIPIRML